MRSADITTEQSQRLMKQIATHLRYLNRIVERMNRRGFSPTDELYQSAKRSRAALQDLHVAAHYAGCKSGVAK
jgi:hypothetical protein